MVEFVQAQVPMLEVRDLRASIDFYTNTLGFRLQASWGHDPAQPTWASLSHGPATMMLTQIVPHDLGDGAGEHSHDPALSGAIYLYPDDVDALAKELDGKVPFEWGPQTMVYEMREVAIRDPDGYLLIFGAEAGDDAHTHDH